MSKLFPFILEFKAVHYAYILLFIYPLEYDRIHKEKYEQHLKYEIDQINFYQLHN